MRFIGRAFTGEFKGWVRAQSEDGKVVSIDPDDVLAQFEKSTWEPQKGKIPLKTIYHTLDKLLDIEEDLTIPLNGRIVFPAFVDEIQKAITAYKGSKDTTPKRHSPHDEDVGFYLR